MLIKTVHGSDGHTLEQLGCEGSRVGHQEISNCVHVFLEGRDLLLRLLNVAQVVLLSKLTFFLLLERLLLHAFDILSLFNLDSHESFPERDLSLLSVDKSHRWLLVLVAVHAHIKELVEELLVVGR